MLWYRCLLPFFPVCKRDRYELGLQLAHSLLGMLYLPARVQLESGMRQLLFTLL